MTEPRTADTDLPADRPWPLLVACAVAALEAATMLVLAVWELISLNSARMEVALSTAAFFLLYGVVLGFCTRGLWQGNAWARSPVVMAQLIQLGVAWNLRTGETLWMAVVITVVSAVVLAGIFHPRSLAAVTRH